MQEARSTRMSYIRPLLKLTVDRDSLIPKTSIPSSEM